MSSYNRRNDSFRRVIRFSRITQPIMNNGSLLNFTIRSFRVSIRLLINILSGRINGRRRINAAVFRLQRMSNGLISAIMRIFARITFYRTLDRVLVNDTCRSSVSVCFLITSCQASFSFLRNARRLRLRFMIRISRLVRRRDSSINGLRDTLLILIYSHGQSLRVARRF